MIRPVRQLTIKSLLFLVVLWSLLAIPIAHLPKVWEGENGLVLLAMVYAVYYGTWTIPILTSVFFRSIKTMGLASLVMFVLTQVKDFDPNFHHFGS